MGQLRKTTNRKLAIILVEQTMFKKSDALLVEAGMCFSVLLVARPVEGGETLAEVASNEKAVGYEQHPGPGTFWVFLI